jgi:CheY-like chemotaxis protein
MKATILIVDDERNLRITLADILASRGYEILEAENSVDALDMLRDQNPDLVFCDWKCLMAEEKNFYRHSNSGRRSENLRSLL